MADTAVAPSSPKAPTSPKAPASSKPKKAAAKPKSPKAPKVAKPKTPSSHPTYIEMVKRAIDDLKEGHKGSSRAAVLKYILSHFNVGEQIVSINAHLRQALKRGVTSGVLIQSKGTGASGSFRLASKSKDSTSAAKKPKTKAVKKDATAASPKKTTKPKKTKTASTKAAAPKSPATKKPTKAAAKPKTTKPKKPEESENRRQIEESEEDDHQKRRLQPRRPKHPRRQPLRNHLNFSSNFLSPFPLYTSHTSFSKCFCSFDLCLRC
ncbi:Histone H1.5 [Aphelenchoides besseyi]|nr:Histone H1.5 [Aphelenchoides besseyi]